MEKLQTNQINHETINLDQQWTCRHLKNKKKTQFGIIIGSFKYLFTLVMSLMNRKIFR